MKNDSELIEYVPNGCIHDMVILSWWARLVQTGDIDSLFTKSARSLSSFYSRIANPSTLLFKAKDNFGIWFVGIFTPYFDGATLDVWVAKEFRQSKQWPSAFCELMEYAFERWPVVISLTIQENILDEYRRMGYTIIGSVPMFWEGKDVHIGHITKESFDKREFFLFKRSA